MSADDPADAPKVAADSRIQQVVARPEEVIGQVDAVILGTDDGHEPVRRARPFVEAGLPMFVDKPPSLPGAWGTYLFDRHVFCPCQGRLEGQNIMGKGEPVTECAFQLAQQKRGRFSEAVRGGAHLRFAQAYQPSTPHNVNEIPIPRQKDG
jgi:hypothetical protein